MTTATPSIIGDLAVETDGLVKTFGATRAVDGVNLAIPRGSVYGVLGPNGAGKTTTIRILATLLRPDGGSARVLGHDVVREAAAVRRLVSLTGQFASVDADLTAEENLLLLARLLGHSRRRARRRAGELLAAFGLTGAAREQAARLSGGMRRKLDLAASIIVAPTCCSWTSRPPAWTRAAAAHCGRSSAASWPTGQRCCSPPSTSTRPTSSPTGSPSSTTAG